LVAGRRVLIIVENLPVPLDRRVWTEALSLRKAGFQVAVICPATARHPEAYEYRDGIYIYRHPLPLEASGPLGFIAEYAAALYGELRLAFKVRKQHGFDIIQLCNPPDILFLVALVFRLLDGVRIVFDHHDPFPELFDLKFPKLPLLGKIVRLCERLTFRLADQVITTSEALRRIALERGCVAPERVTLVRSGIDLSKIPPTAADPALRRGFRHVVAYLGIIGSQDGVDYLIAAARELRRIGRDDILFLVIGDGPMKAELEAQAADMTDYVTFTGYVTGEPLYRLLASSDVGVCPDPKNAFNDKLTMNKVLEYMAFGLGVVMFPLDEGMTLAGDAAMVADGLDARALAGAIARLLDDVPRREQLRLTARAHVEAHFTWPTHERAYLQVYERLAASFTAASHRPYSQAPQ
jgi:glycosyltransferase involved in cell wall biosynthesis